MHKCKTLSLQAFQQVAVLLGTGVMTLGLLLAWVMTLGFYLLLGTGVMTLGLHGRLFIANLVSHAMPLCSQKMLGPAHFTLASSTTLHINIHTHAHAHVRTTTPSSSALWVHENI